MFADGLFNVNLSESVLFIIRIIATVAGALAGWFIADPITRLVYRLVYGDAAPDSLLFGSKLIGALAVGAAVYFFLPLSWGGGYGPGPGGGPGKGKGDGSGKIGSDGADPKNNQPLKSFPGNQSAGEVVEILIIRRDNYKEDKRFYLLKDSKEPKSLAQIEDHLLALVSVEVAERAERKEDQIFRISGAEKAITLDAVKDKFKNRSPRIDVRPIMHEDSIGRGKKDNPWEKLMELGKAYEIVKTD